MSSEQLEGHGILFDNRLDQYQFRLTNGWAKRFLEAAKLGPCNASGLSLVAELRSICIAASFPHTVVSSLAGFYRGFLQAGEQRDLARYVRLSATRLCEAASAWTGKDALSNDQLARMRSESLRISNQADSAAVVDLYPNLQEQAWHAYLEDKGFALGLWGTQRQAYVSVYNAYESFLTASIKSAGNLSSYRDKPKKGLKEHFGAEVLEACWECSPINLGRLVRHAISHAEGKETAELSRLQHDIVKSRKDGTLHIYPSDIRVLLKAVEDGALHLANNGGQ